jgi:hypothetical protein
MSAGFKVSRLMMQVTSSIVCGQRQLSLWDRNPMTTAIDPPLPSGIAHEGLVEGDQQYEYDEQADEPGPEVPAEDQRGRRPRRVELDGEGDRAEQKTRQRDEGRLHGRRIELEERGEPRHPHLAEEGRQADGGAYPEAEDIADEAAAEGREMGGGSGHRWHSCSMFPSHWLQMRASASLAAGTSSQLMIGLAFRYKSSTLLLIGFQPGSGVTVYVYRPR